MRSWSGQRNFEDRLRDQRLAKRVALDGPPPALPCAKETKANYRVQNSSLPNTQQDTVGYREECSKPSTKPDSVIGRASINFGSEHLTFSFEQLLQNIIAVEKC